MLQVESGRIWLLSWAKRNTKTFSNSWGFRFLTLANYAVVDRLSAALIMNTAVRKTPSVTFPKVVAFRPKNRHRSSQLRRLPTKRKTSAPTRCPPVLPIPPAAKWKMATSAAVPTKTYVPAPFSIYFFQVKSITNSHNVLICRRSAARISVIVAQVIRNATLPLGTATRKPTKLFPQWPVKLLQSHVDRMINSNKLRTILYVCRWRHLPR